MGTESLFFGVPAVVATVTQAYPAGDVIAHPTSIHHSSSHHVSYKIPKPRKAHQGNMVQHPQIQHLHRPHPPCPLFTQQMRLGLPLLLTLFKSKTTKKKLKLSRMVFLCITRAQPHPPLLHLLALLLLLLLLTATMGPGLSHLPIITMPVLTRILKNGGLGVKILIITHFLVTIY